MSYSRALFQMVRADVLERVRRYSFLLASGFSLYFGYVANAGGVNLQFGLYHGVSNSAWRGCVIGLVASVLLSLIGFYFVNNTIQRDRETRVGRILAATPMSRFQYTLSKALSNFVVLGFMTLMLAAPALFIEIIRKADGPHNIFALLSPILILGLCALSVTASLAVLFETTKALRGGGGNVVYFFLWISLLTVGATAVSSLHSATVSTSFLDYTGLGTMSQQMQAQLHRLDPLFKDGFSFNIGSFPSEKRTFFWAGLNWKVPLIFSRAIWLGLAVGLIVFASTLFDRFDPGCEILGARPFPKEPSAVLSEEERSFVQKTRAKSEQRITFDPSSGSRLRPRFSMLVLAELNLLLHGKKWWWYAVAVCLFLGCLAAPPNVSRSTLLLAAWLWPVPMWSQLGTREAEHNTVALIFSSAHSFPLQFLSSWIAGFILAIMTGGGLIIRLLFAGDLRSLATLTVAAVFIPSLALALGVCIGSRKPFEGFYSALLYLGPLHHMRYLDFVGSELISSTPIFYFLVSVALLLIAYFWREARLRQGWPA